MRLRGIYVFVNILIFNWNLVFSLGRYSQLKRSNERDPYIFNLFEMILTTLESKLKRVESMDRTLIRLEKRLDDIEGKLSETLSKSSKAANILENRNAVCLDGTEPIDLPKITRKVRHRPVFKADPVIEDEHKPYDIFTQSKDKLSPLLSPISTVPLVKVRPTAENFFRVKNLNKNQFRFVSRNEKNSAVESKLREVVNRIMGIDSKLSTLQQVLEGNMIPKNAEELLASGSESYGVGLQGIPASIDDESKPSIVPMDFAPLQESVEDIRSSLNSVDRRLEIHANAIGQSFTEMTKGINALKGTMYQLNTDKHHCKRKNYTNVQSNSTECITPIDELREETDKILQTLIEKKEDTRSVKDGQIKQTKTLEQLRKQMTGVTSEIIGHLTEIRHNFKQEKKFANIFSSGGINPIALLQRSASYDRKIHIPQILVHNKDILKNESRRDSFSSDNFRHSGVIFPQQIRKPPEYSFVSTSSESNAGGYSCLELMEKGEKKSGVYHLKIKGTTYWFLQAYCDMTTAGGGWTVIQRRDDFGRPRENFNRGWEDYKHGFGNPNKQFWLGNENIFMLTNTEDYILRVTMEDFDGSKRFAEYSKFKLHSEDEMYKLEIGGYSGNAGDSLNDPWYGSNLSPFSTFDKDNDRSSLNCAAMLKGGWWWRSCGRGLNGLYFTNPNDFTGRQGIVWFRWKGWDYTLKKTSLMIKPKKLPATINVGLAKIKPLRNTSVS